VALNAPEYLETIIAARLLGVDPFDQPAVEEGKILAKKYLGKDKYPFSRPGEVRVIFEIEPAAVQVMG